MKFSVVIPCYNSSKTIAVALESLVKQSFTDFDVVVIDDASDDYAEMQSVAEEYSDRLLIRVIRNSINMNGAYSRNRGIAIAGGEFIAFLDSDDSWMPDRLETAWELIRKISVEKFVIYGQFELVRNHPTGALLPMRGIRKGELVSDYVFAASQQMQTSTFVCPLMVARKIMFDEVLTRHQDSDFMMRAQQSGVELIFQHRKCATYFFTAENFRQRVSSGRINSEFCTNWLDSKKAYFSSSSIAGYKLVVFSRILYMEGDILKSLETFVLSLGKVGFRNFAEFLTIKVYAFYKSRLGL